MYRAFTDNNFAQEVWCLPIVTSGGTAASSKITVLTQCTEAGTIHLYIAGKHVDDLNIGTTDTVTGIATLISAKINEDASLPVWASVTGPDVTVTAKNKNINSNDITMQLNYYGKVGGQETPVGFTLTLPAMLGTGTGGVVGAGLPDFDLGIANQPAGQHEAPGRGVDKK